MKLTRYAILFFSLFSSVTGHANNCDTQSKPATFDQHTAMQAIFCQYNRQQGGTLIPLQHTAAWNSHQAQTLASPLLVETYSEKNTQKGVLVVQRQKLLEGKPEHSHAAGVVLSIYTFRFDGQHWIYEKGNKHAAESGSFGTAPKGKLIKLGNDRYGLIFHGGFTGQGHTVTNTFIISLSDEGILENGQFDTGQSNGGACSDDPEDQKQLQLRPCWEYQGNIEFIQLKDKDYYLLRVSYSGTHSSDTNGVEQVLPKTDKVCYSKNGSAYQIVNDPQCQFYTAIRTQ